MTNRWTRWRVCCERGLPRLVYKLEVFIIFDFSNFVNYYSFRPISKTESYAIVLLISGNNKQMGKDGGRLRLHFLIIRRQTLDSCLNNFVMDHLKLKFMQNKHKKLFVPHIVLIIICTFLTRKKPKS